MKWIKKNGIKGVFITLSILFIFPSIIYLVNNKTIVEFNNYYNFFINDGSYKALSSLIYLLIFLGMSAIYIFFIKKENSFLNFKKLFIYILIVGIIFVIMLPWTSSDIFYYMGVGELDAEYNQNPYYTTMKEYYDQNSEKIDDKIFEKGAHNYWANTVVVYGPVAQFIFRILAKISFKNIDVCILVFKLVNLLFHMLNCYLIYVMTKKLKHVIIYGLNPFILLEFIGNVHNDIIIVFFILLSLYFLIKKERILPSVFFLAIATGIKYFSVLLLPVVILYHFREEKKLLKRFLRCIQYGVIFLLIFLLEYSIYFKDINVLLTAGAQNAKYCKSIYSGIYSMSFINKEISQILNWNDVMSSAHWTMFGIFVILYIKFGIDLLFTREIKLEDSLRKYNFMLILFLISLSSFQQWYLIWIFATIIWQKKDTIKDVIILTLASEIANSIYMFKAESWRYDGTFIMIILLMYIVGKMHKNNFIDKRNEEQA